MHRLVLKSDAFEDGGEIPSPYTCEGGDISPALTWEGLPEGTLSLVLIVDDPDAPSGTWVHWVLYDLPAETNELAEDVARSQYVSGGAKQGLNDFRHLGYGGPCPPVGRHRYFFKLYALDTSLSFAHPPTKAQLEQAMKGHVLAHAELVGTYQRGTRR